MPACARVVLETSLNTSIISNPCCMRKAVPCVGLICEAGHHLDILPRTWASLGYITPHLGITIDYITLYVGEQDSSKG